MMSTSDMDRLPRSYLSSEERESYLKEGDMALLYSAESRAADEAGDGDTAWAWLAKTELPAHTLSAIKEKYGARFIREMGFLTQKADLEYGADWLEQPVDTPPDPPDEAIAKLIRMLAQNDLLTEIINNSESGQKLAEVRNEEVQHIREVERTGDLSLMIATERAFVLHELKCYANSPQMVARTQTAFEHISQVEFYIALLEDPKKYEMLNQTPARAKQYKDGLPYDKARQGLTSEIAWLDELDQGYLTGSEKDVMDARRSMLNTATQLYMAYQAQALGIAMTRE